MSNRRAYALILTILLTGGSTRAQDGEFPIGAWFPGLFNDQSTDWAARLDLVQRARFNTIHAAQEARNTASQNQGWMAEAHTRGLKVQLYNWNVPDGWLAPSTRFWSQTFEAEDSRFTHPIGESTADGWRARMDGHSPGLLLDTPSTGSGFWLRSNPNPHPDANDEQYSHHVFWLKTDDITGSDQLATLRVIDHPDGTVLASVPVLESDFDAVDDFQGFPVEYEIPRRPGHSGDTVGYQIEWTGRGNLEVDLVRANDSYGRDLFRGRWDMRIETDLADYYGDTVAPPWRFYVFDEPRWSQADESIAYVDAIFRRSRHGRPGVTAFNQGRERGYMEHFVDTAQPSEFLVDFYPFGINVPAITDPDAATTYPGGVRNALANYKTWYGDAREVAQGAEIPLWAVVQGHDWTNLRDVTGPEIRAQVNLALAHGATGIYYFMVSSHTDPDADAEHSGLLSPTYQATGVWADKWAAVTAMNTKLEALAPTYLALTSNEVFEGTAPDDFVHGLSAATGGTTDYFLGTFTHTTDDSRYLMIVNERCQVTNTPADMRTVTVTLDATDLQGDAYDYTLFDVYGDRRLPAGAGGSETHPEFEEPISKLKLFK